MCVRYQVGKPLRRDPQRVADGQADSPFAQVECEDAGLVEASIQFHYRRAHATVEIRVLAPWPIVDAFSKHTAKPCRKRGTSPCRSLALGVVIAILYFGRLFFITSLLAITIAFILEPFVALLMRIRFPRSLASFVVCSFALAVLYVIGLGAYTQIAGHLLTTSQVRPAHRRHVDGVQQKISGMEDQTYQILVPARQRRKRSARQQQRADAAAAKKGKRKAAPQPQHTQPIVCPAPSPRCASTRRARPSATTLLALEFALSGVLMASFIPFLVYFMLSWRDHINRSFLQFFHGEDRLVAARSLQGIADMVRAFVVGNFLLGLMLATVSSIMFWSHAAPLSRCWSAR